jgi:hypothetical protein
MINASSHQVPNADATLKWELASDNLFEKQAEE